MLSFLEKPVQILNEEAEPLPEELIKHGYRYKLIRRNSYMALYQQAYRNSDTVVAHELFHIKHKTRIEPDSDKRILNEAFPNDEAFGTWAWSVSPNQEKG